jgi:hypothetical protein
MLKLITHIHPPYTTDGWNNPDNILEYAIKKRVYVELDPHNSLLWTRAHHEAFTSEYVIAGIELGLMGTDVIAVGENLSELARDKRFPIFDRKVKRMLDVSFEEGIEILRRIGIEYICLPHPTCICGAAKNGYDKDQLSKADAIEVWNGSISFIPIRYNQEALILAEKLNKPKIAGVDGHIGLSSLDSCYNLVDATCKEEIYEAIKKGRTNPHISSLYPFQLLRDYTVMAFSVARDVLTAKLKISPSDFTSSTRQLY